MKKANNTLSIKEIHEAARLLRKAEKKTWVFSNKWPFIERVYSISFPDENEKAN